MKRGWLWVCWVLAALILAGGCGKTREPKPFKAEPGKRVPIKPVPDDSSP